MGRHLILFTATFCLSMSFEAALLAQPSEGLEAAGNPVVTGAQSIAIIARGDSSSVQSLRAVAVNSADEWRALVPSLSDRTDAAIQRPPVDFARQTVIAVFQGYRGRGGRGIQIEEITEHPTRIVVSTTELVPRPNCTAISRKSPYEIVVIPKTTKRIELDTMMEMVACE